MKVAILGGGFTGMTAAYYLAKKGHEVKLLEKEKVLGGLAVGFKQPNWDWYLERAYHHLLDSEDDILNFAKDVGFDEIFFRETITSSLYDVSSHPELVSGSGFNGIPDQVRDGFQKVKMEADYRIFPLDSPQDFLRFPLLSWPEKIRAGMVLAFLKTSPFLSLYEKLTAEEFLKKTQGKHVWEVLWQELFRKKFGKYAENILASFIWARITKRAKKLGYIKGGFQTLINYVENRVKGLGVRVKKDFTVDHLGKSREGFVINNKEKFDVVISTLPTIIMSKLTQTIFQQSYLQRFSHLRYLHAVVLILETKQPILEKTYWLNVCVDYKKLPLMFIGQHTNFIDKKYYGGNHIAYIGWYLDRSDQFMKMKKEELINYCLPHLKKINNQQLTIKNSYLFHGPFAQPIYDRDFLKNKPDFITPVKNFYIANLDMTYPYDRGTNYAVKLGKEVSKLI